MKELFEVTKILDGNTLEVTPFWQWRSQNGVLVYARGYQAPAAGKPNHEEIRTTLMGLLFGERVTLKDAVTIQDDALVCNVYIKGTNLAEYFPTYQ
jgi:hypothetical protein